MSFDVESTADVLRSLVDQSLREVFYLYSSGAAPTAFGDSSGSHEVPYGLRLVTSRSVPTTLTWVMEGDCAALVAVEGSGESVGITDLIEAHDVSATRQWRPFLGAAITN